MVQEEKRNTWMDGLGLFQKVIFFGLIFILILLAWSFVFGGINSLWDFLYMAILTAIVVFLIYIVSFFAENRVVRPVYHEAYEDYKTKIVNLAMIMKPDNVYNLVFRGSESHQRVTAGKIIGLLGVPDLIGIPKRNEQGDILFTKSPVLNNADIPVFDSVEVGEDGDYLIVYERGWFLWKKQYLFRCAKNFIVGELHGDIIINDINPDYVGLFQYPFKQKQEKVTQILIQQQLEAIISTQTHQLDYISWSFDQGIYSNPTTRALLQDKSGMVVSSEK